MCLTVSLNLSRMARRSQPRGHDHRFVYSIGKGHCDGRIFRQTLADTLVWNWRGYHAD